MFVVLVSASLPFVNVAFSNLKSHKAKLILIVHIINAYCWRFGMYIKECEIKFTKVKSETISQTQLLVCT